MTGVEIAVNGAPSHATVRGEAVLCAGAIGSPQILQLSGVGGPEILARAGIPVRVARRSVGENLQDHLQLRPIFRLHGTRTLNDRARSPIGRLGIGLEYLLHRSGPIAMAPSQLGIFAKSGPDVARADLCWHIQALSFDKLGEPLHPFSGITTSVCDLRPESRGTVTVSSPRAEDPPLIQGNYLTAERDRVVAVRALRITRQLMAAPAMAIYAPEEHLPGMDRQSDDELLADARRMATTMHHHVGTCRMGSDTEAVVDPRLRVNGLANLRVADASVMPSIVSSGTNAPTIMIAERAADLILEDQRR